MYLCLPDLLVAPFSRYFVSFFEASESIVFVSVSICLHSCYCPSLHPFIEGWGLLFWNFPQMECSEFFNKKGEVVLKLGGITNTGLCLLHHNGVMDPSPHFDKTWSPIVIAPVASIY